MNIKIAKDYRTNSNDALCILTGNANLYSRVQELMNIKIAKGYRTTSNDALCILTGNAPVEIKAEEGANLYRITKDKQNQQLDHET